MSNHCLTATNSRSVDCCDVKTHELENERRSLAMLSPHQRCGWSREKAMEVLAELIETKERVVELESQSG